MASETPDIRPLLQKEMEHQFRQVRPDWTDQQAKEAATQMLDFASKAGTDMRFAMIHRKAEQLRNDLVRMGRLGRYPKHLWAKLRAYEAELRTIR